MSTPFAVWPPLTWGILVAPVVAGLLGTLAPAFGYLPAIGLTRPGLEAFVELLALPGVWVSVALTLCTTLAATALAWLLACAFVASTTALPRARPLRRLLSPLLAAPHVAIALGLAFLVAPSGFLIRLVSPALSGLTSPPLWVFPGDPFGIALVLALVVKEMPFLVLMLLAAQAGRPVERQLLAARSLGHGPLAAWSVAVLPQLYPSLRLPLFAVIAYGASPVDMALVLGPSVPPVLAVRVIELLGHPDLVHWATGAAAAVLLLALAGLAMVAWWLCEWPVQTLAKRLLRRGPPARPRVSFALPALVVPAAVGVAGLASLAVMMLWSIAGRWRFPDSWPDDLHLDAWIAAPDQLGVALLVTAGLALVVGLAATSLALLCLEAETHRSRPVPARWQLWLYLPLVVPQAAFLFGIQVLLVALRVDGSLTAVALVHLTFVLPYAFLALAGAVRTFDPRWALVGRSLGHRPGAVFWRIKLPMLAAPVATAFALSVAVSAALYLPTLFAGSGQVRTLALEAVALASSDRRSAGVVVTLLAALPMCAFLLAALVRARVERRA